MDIQEYLNQYTEVSQIVRGIYLLSEVSPEESSVACRYLLEKCKTQDCVSFYKEILQFIKEKRLTSIPTLPDDEIVSWESRFRESVDNKEYKINQAKNSGLKDTHRVNIIELGDFFYRSGDMNNAMKLYLRAKESTVTPEQQFELFNRMALTSLQKKNFSFAANNAQKVMTLQSIPEKLQNTAMVISGICNIENGNYKQATEFFLRAGFENNKELASHSDLAAYISVCCLCSMNRTTISTDVLKSKSFLTLCEEEPRYIELLECFLTCKFLRLIQILEQIRKYLRLDIYIGKYINNICDEIKNKCLIQYMKAFKRIRISELAVNFCCSDKEIEAKLAKLIMDGKVDARIDAHLKIVSSHQVDEKNKANRKVLNSAKAYLKNCQLLLLRMSMIQEAIIVKGK